MSPRVKKTLDWRHNDRPGRPRRAAPFREPARFADRDVVALRVTRHTIKEDGRVQRKLLPGTEGYVERSALGGTVLRVVVRVAPDGKTDVVVVGSSEVELVRKGDET